MQIDQALLPKLVAKLFLINGGNGQDSWWHPSSETSPATMDPALMERGEPAKINEWSIYLWNESQNEFGAKVTVTKFGNSQRNLLSPDEECQEYTSYYRKLATETL